MQRLLPWILFLLAMIALAALLHRNLDQQRELALVRGDRARLEADLRRNSQQLRQAKGELESARADAARKVASVRGSAAASRSTGTFISFDAMRKDPKYAALWRQIQARSIQRQYGGAIAAMKLTPDQERQLRALLMERDETAADARTAAAESGLSKEASKACGDAINEVNAQIRGLIGDDQFAGLEGASRLENFALSLNFTVVPDLELAGTPLDSNQIYALAKIYSDSITVGNGPSASAGGLDARDQAIVDQAAGILSPPQIEALKQSMQTDQLEQQYFNQQRQAQATHAGGSITVITH
ncbi:MAG TPA: hypothetical protein VFE31_08475 [Opitutaceae bacterium]|jgi:hypothetical protein|nr:hypothetical protein [Opitutaceae bacterium]